MKRVLFSIILILTLCSTAKAEFRIYDASGNYLGILIGMENGYFPSTLKYDIYNPTKGYYFQINVYSYSPYNAPGDITHEQYMYFTKPNCTGEMYVASYGGLLNAVIKHRYAYYKITGGAQGLYFASYRNNDGCNNSQTSEDIYYSKIVKISKPFGFLPAKSPFKVNYVAP